MKTPAKKEMSDKDSRLFPIEPEETVRGSGYTYNEKAERTDKSIPRNKVDDEEVVQLPDLGQPNRP
jgi:hypothetical protein